MKYDYEDTIVVIEDIVVRIFNETDISAPPVNPFLIARKLKIPCTESQIEGRRGQNFVLNGHRIIDINKEDRFERKCFTLAHELIEILLPPNFKNSDERHDIAVLGAPYLLMPTDWFGKACRETEFDIFKLKEIFSTASHEAIAIRTLSFASAIITIIDDKKITNRQSSMNTPPCKRLMHIEKEEADKSVLSGQIMSLKNDECDVTAFPLLEEEVKRVILRTVPNDSLD